MQKIIANTSLDEIGVKKLVQEKRDELKGLISEEGALYIVAKELGVDLNGVKAKKSTIQVLKGVVDSISEVSEEMKNIVIFGRIREIYDLHKFTRKKGDDGIVGSFILYDSSGEIKVVLWDLQTRIYADDRFAENEILKIINGTIKISRNGETEIHLGNYSGIELGPSDVDYLKYPTIKPLVDINSINLTRKSVTIEGIISQKYPIKEFTRKDETTGKVGNLFLRDATGTTKVTFWDANTQKIKDFVAGDVVSITHLTPKKSTFLENESIELYASVKTEVKKIDKIIEIGSEEVDDIETLRSKDGLVTFKAVVASVDSLKEVTLQDGEKVSVLNFTLSDETAFIQGSAWRKKAKKLAQTLTVGQIFLFKHVSIKPYRGIAQVSVVNESIVEKVG